jgi:hypothetical protein
VLHTSDLIVQYLIWFSGSLTTGKGNRCAISVLSSISRVNLISRFVLANTESLHEKINQLSNRVRQLEDALAQSHALNSNFSHPLLSEELLQIKRPLERERVDIPPAKEEKPEINDNIDSLGSL